MKRIKRFAIGTVLIFAIILSAFSFTAYGNENAVTSTDVPLSDKLDEKTKELMNSQEELINVVVYTKGRDYEKSYSEIKDEFLAENNISLESFEFHWQYNYSLWLTPEQIIVLCENEYVESIEHFDTLLKYDYLYKGQDGQVYIRYTAEDALTLLQMAVGLLSEWEVHSGNDMKFYHLRPVEMMFYSAEHALIALQSCVGKIEIVFHHHMIFIE